MELCTTNLTIANLHCSTCTSTVDNILSILKPPPVHTVCSIEDRTVLVGHDEELSTADILQTLLDAGFVVEAVTTSRANGYRIIDVKRHDDGATRSDDLLSDLTCQLTMALSAAKTSLDIRHHLDVCQMCRKDEILEEYRQNKMSAIGRTIIDEKKNPTVMNSREVISNPTDNVLAPPLSAAEQASPANDDAFLYRATISIEGMTCAACSGRITEVLEELPWVNDVNINLIKHSGTIIFDARATEGPQQGGAKIVDAVEDCGYGATIATLVKLENKKKGKVGFSTERKLALKVMGLHCPNCPNRILSALENTFAPPMLKIVEPLSLKQPVLHVLYTPRSPQFTLRDIIKVVADVDPSFSVRVHHPPTVEERSLLIESRERCRLLLRFALCCVTAIPTFLIGIVWMSLVDKSNHLRIYFEKPILDGDVPRSQWALLFLSTPVYFCVADVFHTAAIRELKALWRPGSTVPIWRRFYRFGSMNLLVSLGVTISYLSSVGLLISSAIKPGSPASAATLSTYFDSTVFLTLFLLFGRLLERYSKSKATGAIGLLTQLRPREATLLVPENNATQNGSGISKEFGNELSDEISTEHLVSQKIDAELLERGDFVVVPTGSSPPVDGIIATGTTQFDESSLTGEGRLVEKIQGDIIHAGTINAGSAITMKTIHVTGELLLDQIVDLVRDGESRRAPIESIANVILGLFVPLVTWIALIVFILWLSLGISGSLPDDYLDVSNSDGGWYLWSLGFAIAVFVVACPCGIGLAAPTAFVVGSGLAAKYGILSKGGDGFQQASNVDCIVFDKTGTLTDGADPKVLDEMITTTDLNPEILYALTTALEETSTHPLARAVAVYCRERHCLRPKLINSTEVHGKGLEGEIEMDGVQYEVQIGSERFLKEGEIRRLRENMEQLKVWKMRGQSVVLLALRIKNIAHKCPFTLAAAFATANLVRPEASTVIQKFQERGVNTWMITGDNASTAVVVAGTVGIPVENVIAGVLPAEKADKILELQRTVSEKSKPGSLASFFGRKARRTVVAFVGDGINDAPALAVADVGIAIGSGSDIAIDSANFVLATSNLHCILTLMELGSAVLSRVKLNFLWACIYNLIGLPIAAGVLYPLPNHVRLNPVWASLAMALSSVSVICSSLLLKTNWWLVGFRPTSKNSSI